ncbi:MAG: NUDIX hydrolase [Promethearchaeati archaeon SRVP18_Atabeyarchaeia-1]
MRKGPALTVDILIQSHGGSVVLVKRRNPPFKGEWAIPGGFVEYGETVEAAAKREAKEETGLEVELIKIIGVYSDPNRDPRGHTVTICFLARQVGGELRADSDAESVRTFQSSSLPARLAFDHDRILADAGIKR